MQHAHQKGIIHRDLKPGNVLVTEVDGRPTPKVIDFGVAKATEVKLTDMSFADVGAIVGTPAYMSPEQADPTSMDIDTRTDVYALGVMLYELLTGSPPIDAKQFQRGRSWRCCGWCVALPKDGPELASQLSQIGLTLLGQKKWIEAEPLLRESLAIREKTQPDVWSTFNTQSLLGGVLLGQKKLAEAEPLLKMGYAGMKQREATIPKQAKVRLSEALDRLIDFATTTNKPDDVKKWQAERAKYPATAPPPGQK